MRKTILLPLVALVALAAAAPPARAADQPPVPGRAAGAEMHLTPQMQGCLDQIKATTDRGKGAFEAIVMVDDGCIALLRDNAEFRSYINTRLTYAMHRDEARQWRKDQQSVVGAYMVIWVLTAGFVGLLWMRQRKVKGELARLRADLDRATKDDGP
ncbi:MAG: hypothetical protein H6709_10065 [Kofleriaceae bacterium]|nr:hypothetical protein [Myxococcales bacterium]MCB9572419.1 hypothetical protein [Kofleriaceae bacterium]